jgi:hypothetical protein
VSGELRDRLHPLNSIWLPASRAGGECGMSVEEFRNHSDDDYLRWVAEQ